MPFDSRAIPALRTVQFGSMARGVVLTHLLGVCLLLVKFSKTGGLPQPSRHVDSPEDSNNVEFRSNSMGVTKVIDLRTGTIAYKDHILKSCYIEKISSQSAWEKNRVLLIHPRLLTNTEVGVIGGPIVANFCFGWPSKILRHATNVEVRSKRSNKPYYFVARKPRGQTQSQYLQFGNGEDPGRAEAESTRQGSKARVYGTRGMGQAQSQSDPFSCADCFGAPGFQESTTQLGPGYGIGQISGGRQFDALGRPITSGGPGLGQTDSFGRPIGTGLSGLDGDRGAQTGRGSGAGQQFGVQQGVPGELQSPDSRLVHPGITGQTGGAPGTAFQPGQSIVGELGSGGQLLTTPDGRVIHPGSTDQNGKTPGATIYTRPTENMQLPGRPRVPDSFQTRPGQIGGLSEIIGRPGTYFQTRPGQIGDLPGTTSGPGTPLQVGSLPGAPGGPGFPSYYVPGQPDTGQIRFQPGITGGPATSIRFPGETIGAQGVDVYRPEQSGIQQGPGTSTFFTPGSLQIPGTSGRPGTEVQAYPSQGAPLTTNDDISGQRGRESQAPGSLQTRPGVQIYDQGGLHKPSGQPVHPGDIGIVSSSGQIQQEGPQGGGATQPGPTTYYIPGGIKPRPGDTSYGYYPSPGIPGGRIPSGTGSQDGSFQGHVAGEYRPASGHGGEFAGSFQGTYHPHGGESGHGGYGDRTLQGSYPGGTTGDQLPGLDGTQWPQKPGVSNGLIPGTVTTGSGQMPGGIQIGSRTYIPGQSPIPSDSQTTGRKQTWGEQYPSGADQTGLQQGLQQGLIPTGRQPGTGLLPGQQETHRESPQYPSGAGQHGLQPGTGLQPGLITTDRQSGTGLLHGQQETQRENPQYTSGVGQPGFQQEIQIPGQQGGAGYTPGHISTDGRQPGYQQGTSPSTGQISAGRQYPSQPGYDQGISFSPGQLISPGGHIPTTGGGTKVPLGHTETSGRQYPGQTGYQHADGLQPGQITTGGIQPGQITTGGIQPGQITPGRLQPGQISTGRQYPGQPGYQQGTGLIPGQISTGVVSQPGYQQGTGLIPGYPGTSVTGTQIAGQRGDITSSGQPIFGPQEEQITAAGGVQDGRNIYQGGVGPGGQQIGQYQVPGALLSGHAGQEADDGNTQAQSTIHRAGNETQASASSSGRYAGGNAQSQVSGSYAGTGSFSASAGTNDGLRGAQTQVSGNSEGTLSSSQGVGGRAKSQAQVQLSADTGDTQSSAQTSGLNHGTNTQVNSGIKGGMADAQANGPGSTSSQAQIGFKPYDATNNDDDPAHPHNGGGTASASSGTHAGKSQVQINGKYAFGIRYTGQAQASSANSGYTADKINLPTMRPIDFSNDPYSKPAKQEKVNVRQIDDPSLIKIITTTTTPTPDADEDEYDDYEDPEPSPPPRNSRQNLVQQARTRSLMRDTLDPLEDDIDDHGIDIQNQLKHGDIIQAGHFIPGSTGYKIPPGFRGRVTDDSGLHETTPIYVAGANANRRGNHEGYGSGYTYQPRYSPVQYGLKSSNQPKNFVSVTKSETGSRNIITGKKTPSVYYTQSSTCGYFTNTCVYSNGKKICLPKPKANPDGTPIICRN